jgi:hypothetical protein
MISIASDTVIPLSMVGDYCPRRRAGKKVHSSTAQRWAKTGCVADDGTRVTLETIRVGRTLCTSVEALQRFFDRLSAQPQGKAQQALADRPSADTHRHKQERVELELAAFGL